VPQTHTRGPNGGEFCSEVETKKGMQGGVQ